MGAGGHKSGGILTEKTSLLGLRLYVLLAIAFVALLTGCLAALFLFFRSSSRRHRPSRLKHSLGLMSTFSIDIAEIGLGSGRKGGKGFEGNEKMGAEVVVGECSRSKAGAEMIGHIGWGRWFTLAELEAATSGFGEWNVIGEGGYGIVYRGVLPDLSVVAIKNLLNKKYVYDSSMPFLYLLFLVGLDFNLFLLLSRSS